MATVVIALVSFAVAFLAGGVLSKAYFAVRRTRNDGTTEAQLNEQRRRYRKRVDALQLTIRRHEDKQEEIKQKLTAFRKSTASKIQASEKLKAEVNHLKEIARDLRSQLNIREQEIAALRGRNEPLPGTLDSGSRQADDSHNEVSLLRIERDELLARNRRLEAEQNLESELPRPDEIDSGAIAASRRAEMGEMRENLARRDRQVHDLELQLKEREEQIRKLTARLESWKQRVSPLTSKLRQQRNVIRGFRESRAGSVTASVRADSPAESVTDNLKKIRGIGPALERRLHRHGIRRFEQIAALSDDELAAVAEQLAIAPNLAHRDRWVEQALELSKTSAIPA